MDFLSLNYGAKCIFSEFNLIISSRSIKITSSINKQKNVINYIKIKLRITDYHIRFKISYIHENKSRPIYKKPNFHIKIGNAWARAHIHKYKQTLSVFNFIIITFKWTITQHDHHHHHHRHNQLSPLHNHHRPPRKHSDSDVHSRTMQ